MEGPYRRILRRDGSPETRREITLYMSLVQSRISFYSGWMAIHGNESARAAYERFVAAARSEAGKQMTAAWKSRPAKKERDVPVGRPRPSPRTDAAREALLAVLRAELDGR